MEHAPILSRPFPWRTATLVVGALAAVELVAIALLGGARIAHLVRPLVHTHAAAAAATAPARKQQALAHRASLPVPKIPPHPLLSRAHTRVLVLNGNGVSGAAAAEAARIEGLGYAPPAARNAPRHDYARSMVLFVPGYLAEARRLARDAHVRIVAPLDGIRRAALRGSKLVVILGGS
ncbi:MAG TPA: LytR C-terminal domain-containing protein [Gaiellaceae bacterium]|nr:LytR C-terminal domain-containing protein [Gaiellaceae bacterium]